MSNNNEQASDVTSVHDFQLAYKSGQRRIYLKRVQSDNYTDPYYPILRKNALAAKFEVGSYDFLQPLFGTPQESFEYYLKTLALPLVSKRDLRPAIDCETSKQSPSASAAVGKWITEMSNLLFKEFGYKPLVYGNAGYLQACEFPSAPGPLWLANYGIDDGKQHPYGELPTPWKTITAHQYTSKGTCVGIKGYVDMSKVYIAGNIEIPK